MMQLLWKTVWQLLKMLNIELLYSAAIPLLDRYPKDLKTETLTNACLYMFTATLITIERWEKPKCPPIDE